MNLRIVPLLALALMLVTAAPQPWASEVTVAPHRKLPDRMNGWVLQARVDFGGVQTRAPGSLCADGRIPCPHLAIAHGMVRPITRPDHRDRYLCDFLEGEDVELLLPAHRGILYRVILTLGDPGASRGPVAVFAGEDLVTAGVSTAAGEFVDLDFEIMAVSDRIPLRVVSADCGSFALSGVAVYAPSGSTTRKPAVHFTRPRGPVPASAAPPPGTDEEGTARLLLEKLGTYLVTTRPREGCFACSGSWYESSYPVRTLLVGARLLDRPEWREHALACVDRFLQEQRTDANWASTYFWTASCPAAMEATAGASSRNLADVGTMAVCLCLAAPGSTPEDSARYVAAARRYADAVVLPNQLPSGAFPNLRFEGTEYRFPYSVATAVQAANMSALSAVTGEFCYQQASERAALFLARSIRIDGTVEFHPYDSDSARVISPDRLGELFYILEGLFWGHRAAGDAGRREIGGALGRYFEGPSGFRSWPAPHEWLAKESPWENSKRAGFLMHLALYRSLGVASPDLDAWISGLLQALASPEHASAAGVMAEPGLLHSDYSHAATGFAGVGVIALMDPNAVFVTLGF